MQGEAKWAESSKIFDGLLVLYRIGKVGKGDIVKLKFVLVKV